MYAERPRLGALGSATGQLVSSDQRLCCVPFFFLPPSPLVLVVFAFDAVLGMLSSATDLLLALVVFAFELVAVLETLAIERKSAKRK